MCWLENRPWNEQHCRLNCLCTLDPKRATPYNASVMTCRANVPPSAATTMNLLMLALSVMGAVGMPVTMRSTSESKLTLQEPSHSLVIARTPPYSRLSSDPELKSTSQRSSKIAVTSQRSSDSFQLMPTKSTSSPITTSKETTTSNLGGLEASEFSTVASATSPGQEQETDSHANPPPAILPATQGHSFAVDGEEVHTTASTYDVVLP